ncbi:ABC transporter permease [Methanoregula sp.]|uniref:ABC transporter permease n=1 Tax=Methanoregula sp. TaxID=2052170 RepID=UPI003C396E0A
MTPLAGKNPTRKRSRQSQLLAAILVNSVYEMENYPVVLLNTILSPLSILLVIVLVSRGSLFGVGIMGGFIMAMFSAGMGLSSDLSHLKNDFKFQDMIVSSPTGWLTYMIGISLSEIVYAIPALIVLTVLAYFGLSLTLAKVLAFVAVLLLVFISSISIGYTLSTFSSDIVQSFAFTRLISTLFSTIPPVYYPITYIPLPFRYLAYLSPTTYAAELVQGIGGYLSLSLTTVIIDWTVLIAVTIALFVLAKTKARWREV